ncbi:MAG: alpha-L-fucosidase [Acidobacteriota bacterium]
MRPLAFLLASALCFAQAPNNKPERLEWFRDQGFGLFIHWSLDSQIGSVISHSLVGASPDYRARFFNDLPRTFNPRKFHPDDWAALAKLAGIRYVVFTTKHHSGFTMFDTKTTDFGIMNTPFQRDITAELMTTFRAQGIAPGMYFSPDDFWWLHTNNKLINRHIPSVFPANNPGLMEHDLAQVRELLTNYGPIDVMFFDGPPEGLKELAWQLQPNLVVTRGAIETPEQYVPGVPLDEAWEACITTGTQWQYKPTNDVYKTGGELISLLIETRAKGGNLLLNIGPKPDGELPIEQEERLREIALWMFINGEAIHAVRPWVITNEGDYWFTKKRKGAAADSFQQVQASPAAPAVPVSSGPDDADGETLYVIVKPKERWKYGEWKDITLHSVQTSPNTTATILSQNDEVLEYQPGVVPKTTWKQDATGLHIRAMRAQRIYNDRKWPNPVVIKLTNVKSALAPPRVQSTGARWNATPRTATLTGNITALGDAASLQAGFEYRDTTGMDLTERMGSWRATSLVRRTAPGAYTVATPPLTPGHSYEFRAVVKHPLLTLYGEEKQFKTIQK